MEPPNDAEPMETDGGATTGFQPHLTILDNYINLSHEGRYIEYSLSGNIFEVTSKYRPLIKLLGCGASGFINSAMNSETNEKVAIKKIVHACGDNITATRTLREIRLLRLLEHANILGIKDIVLPPKRDAFEDVYIVYELMDTDLEKLLKSNQQLTRDHYLYFMYLFLRGLKYIHSANVLHRNLKPSNLLLNSTNCDLKISDFRLACVASKTQAMSEYASRRWYRAPELLLNSSTYTSAIDVWSVGCIFLEMMTRKPLFPGRDCVHQLRLILEFIGSPTEDDMGSLNESAKQYLRLLPRFDSQSFFEKFPNVPFLAILLVEKMLKFDPRKRISVEDALAHPYFRTWHEINIEPVSTRTFDIDLEEHQLTVEQIKELIHHEYLDFNPEPLPSFQPYPEPTTVENEQ